MTQSNFTLFAKFLRARANPTRAYHYVHNAPPQEELEDLSLACTKLWDLDYERLVPGMDYVSWVD